MTGVFVSVCVCVCVCVYVHVCVRMFVCLVRFELVCTKTHVSSTRSHFTIWPPPSSLLPTHNVHGRWWEDPDLNSYRDMMVCSGVHVWIHTLWYLVSMCEYIDCDMMVLSYILVPWYDGMFWCPCVNTYTAIWWYHNIYVYRDIMVPSYHV